MFTELRERSGLLRRAVRLLDVAATPHGVDRYLELVLPTWSSTEVRGRVIGAERRAPGTVTLTIEANGNWTGFRAGQYVTLTVEIDGVRHSRCYSMANSASGSGSMIELTVKAHPGGLVSSWLVRHAAEGLVVGLSPARGQFVLPERPERPERILLISGGSGITPVMAMLRTLCDDGHRGPVTFVHYCLTAKDLVYSAELEHIAATCPDVELVRIYTDEPGTGDRPGVDGFVTEAQLDAIEPAWRSSGTHTWICGPAPLMDSVRQIYDPAGSAARLHTEAFTLAQVVAETGTAGGTLSFARSGSRAANDGRSVLEQAEAAGLRPPSGCRMGICHTCVCPLTAGAVRDLTTGDVVTAAGTDIRICVSAPLGDVEVEL